MDRNTEVVISGAAGVFPECKGILELEDALFRKAHLITDDHRKWKQNYDIPTYCGKAFSPAKFDATFFNIHYEFPSSMDPIMRQSLETCTEAIIDAGVNPKTLAGTRTAVYSAYESSESELALVLEDNVNTARELNAIAGTYRAYSANRLSFGLNFVGELLFQVIFFKVQIYDKISISRERNP
nr:PREDICTED: fatty acid synthase-like [Bemisia tabaci]